MAVNMQANLLGRSITPVRKAVRPRHSKRSKRTDGVETERSLVKHGCSLPENQRAARGVPDWAEATARTRVSAITTFIIAPGTASVRELRAVRLSETDGCKSALMKLHKGVRNKLQFRR